MPIGMRMICALLIVGRIATAQPVTVGQLAPKLTIGAVIQGRLDEKSGRKATVIEFWATWCPPCREAIPHLNQLADQFKDRPIEFISIAPESEDTVTTFLKTHPMRGIVALDPGRRMFQSYGAGLPTTVLITDSGKIAGATVEPELITPALLEDLLFGRPIDLPATTYPWARKPLAIGAKINDSGAAVRIVITPVLQDSGWTASEDQFESPGTTLSELLAFAYNISSTRVIVPTRLKDRIYAVQAWVPPSHGELLGLVLQNALAVAAGFQVKRERQSVEVLVVKGLPGKLHESNRNPPANQAVPGHYVGDGAELDLLRQQIESMTGKPVVLDRPGNTKVQYDLHWDANKPALSKLRFATNLDWN